MNECKSGLWTGERQVRWQGKLNRHIIFQCLQYMERNWREESTKEAEVTGRIYGKRRRKKQKSNIKKRKKKLEEMQGRQATVARRQGKRSKKMQQTPATQNVSLALFKELSWHWIQRIHIKLANGKLAETHDEIMKRWRNHFREVLNCPEPSTSLNEEQLHNSLDVSMQDISRDEVTRAIKKLKNGKAAGVGEIQPELLKYGEAAVP